jgi:hypothetical protein
MFPSMHSSLPWGLPYGPPSVAAGHFQEASTAMSLFAAQGDSDERIPPLFLSEQRADGYPEESEDEFDDELEDEFDDEFEDEDEWDEFDDEDDEIEDWEEDELDEEDQE